MPSLDRIINIIIRNEHGIGTGLGGLVLVNEGIEKIHRSTIGKLTIGMANYIFGSQKPSDDNILAILPEIMNFEKREDTDYRIRLVNNPLVIGKEDTPIAYTAPVRVFLDISDRCTRGPCKHCHTFSSSKNTTVFDWETLEKLSHELGNIGVFQVKIGGGEPLHPDYVWDRTFPFIKNLRDYGIYVSLSTNGDTLASNIGESLSQRLLGLGVKVSVSIDGPEEIHDLIRGENSYRNTIRALEVLTHYGIRRSIATTLMTYNTSVEPISHLAQLASKYDTTLKVRRAKPSRNAAIDDCVISSPNEEFWKVVKYLNNDCSSKVDVEEIMCLYPSPRPPNDLAFKLYHCGGGISTITISPDHSITPCPFIPFEEKGIKVYNKDGPTLMEVWQEKHIDPNLKFMRKLTESEDCQECNKTVYCHGLCPSLRLAYSGNLTGTDPGCPSMLEKMFH